MHISFYIWTINDKCKQNQRLVEKHQLWQWFMCTYDANNFYLWTICIFKDSNKTILQYHKANWYYPDLLRKFKMINRLSNTVIIFMVAKL